MGSKLFFSKPRKKKELKIGGKKNSVISFWNVLFQQILGSISNKMIDQKNLLES
jgi:hypothetical protein